MAEVVKEHPRAGQRIGTAANIRSTILLAATAALRQRGHFEAWSAALDTLRIPIRMIARSGPT